jgi:hypothetical protein
MSASRIPLVASDILTLTGDEYDRDLLPATLQLPLEFRSTHDWHSDIEDQTASLIDTSR